MPNAPETAAAAVIYPALRYADPDTAISWLSRVLGFVPHAVFRGRDGKVEHAELSLGGAVIMVGPARADALQTRTPAAAGGVTTMLYVYVADLEAHHARASAGGAEIVQPLRDMSYGSREYSVRDLEGHVWSFGTYRPLPAAHAGR